MTSRKLTLPDDCQENLDYFVEWRPYLWLRPVERALEFLGDLRGKRVLEIGGRSGRMTSLLALCGAEVTMLQMGSVATAQAEVEKWGVADRVELIETDGSFSAVEGRKFDAAFTKSVLWCIEHLGQFLDDLNLHLNDDARVAFVENYRGGGWLQWVRKHILHRGKFEYGQRYFGIRKDQIKLFDERYANFSLRSYRYFVFELFGEGLPR
jgi:hypothetical protein